MATVMEIESRRLLLISEILINFQLSVIKNERFEGY